MSVSSTPAGLLATLQAILNNKFLQVLLTFALGVLLFVIMGLIVIASAWLVVQIIMSIETSQQTAKKRSKSVAEVDDQTMLVTAKPGSREAFAEAALESAQKRKQRKAFKYRPVIQSFLVTFNQLFVAAAQLFTAAVTSASNIVQTIGTNWLIYAGFILFFGFYILWDTYHNVIIQAAAPIYTGFVPTVRILILPFISTAAFLTQLVLPISNAIRQLIVNLTTEALFHAVICGFDALKAMIGDIASALSLFSIAFSVWLQTVSNASNNRILDVGPNFFPAAQALGTAIGRLDSIFTCACEPIGEAVIQPLFQPVRSAQFARGINATLTVVPVFLTQGLARPLVRLFQNIRDNPFQSVTNNAVRPSWNSTFDTITIGLDSGASVASLFGVSLFNITTNIIEDASSACPDIQSWKKFAPCSTKDHIGRCVTQGSPGSPGTCVIRHAFPGFTGNTNNFVEKTCPTNNCTAPNSINAPCACTNCLCTYESTVNVPQVRFPADCKTGTKQSNRCSVDLFDPIANSPPVPGIFGAFVRLIFDVPFVQTSRYVVNFVFNIDKVFTTTDGYLIWRADRLRARFNLGIDNLFADTTDWIADLLIAAGNSAKATLGEPIPLTNRVIKRMALSVGAKQSLAVTFSSLGDAIKLGLDFIAAVVRVPGNTIRAIILAVERIIFDEMFDSLIGTIYFAVKTGIATNVPNPFAYAQMRWGDNGPNDIFYTCGYYIKASNDFVPLYNARIIPENRQSCNDEEELLNFCRFVFQHVLGTPFGTQVPHVQIALNLVPDYIDIDQSSVSAFIDQEIGFCNNLVICDPVVTVANPTPILLANLPDNEYNKTLEAFVDIARQFDPLVSVFCPKCIGLEMVFSGFVDPIVSVILPVIDFVIHLDKIFTTRYSYCLDVETALVGIKKFVTNLTNLFRIINNGATGTQCLSGAHARDSRIFCVLAQGIDAFVDIFVKIGITLWRFFQLLIRLISGEEIESALTDFIVFDNVFKDIETIVFDILSVILVVVPRSFLCSAGVSSGQPIQQTLAANIANIISSWLLVLPRLLVEVPRQLVTSILNNAAADAFGIIVGTILTAFLKSIYTTFNSSGIIIACIGAPTFADALFAIATVIQSLESYVTLLTQFITFVFQIFFGILEVVTTGAFTLLTAAITTLFKIVISFVFAIFGKSFICGIQNIACGITSFFSILGASDNDVDFAVVQCRTSPDSQCVSNCDTDSSPDGPPSGCSRKRSLDGNDGFLSITYDDDTYDDRKRSTGVGLPSEQFCGSFLANYNITDAKLSFESLGKKLSDSQKMAADCYKVSIVSTSSKSFAERVDDAMSNNLIKRVGVAVELGREFTAQTVTHWRMLSKKAEMRVMHRAQTSSAHPDESTLSQRIATFKAATLQKHSTLGYTALHNAVWDKFGTDMVTETFTGMLAAAITAHKAINSQEEIANIQSYFGRIRDTIKYGHNVVNSRDADFVKGTLAKRNADKQLLETSTVMPSEQKLGIALSLAIDHLDTIKNDVFAALQQRAVEMFGSVTVEEKTGRITSSGATPYQREQCTKRQATLMAQYRATPFAVQYQKRFQTPLAGQITTLASSINDGGADVINNSTLSALGHVECDPDKTLCTGCALLDNFANTSQRAIFGLRDYYTSDTYGYNKQLETYEFEIETTLTNPLGDDFYTTVNKKTPWIGERFRTVHWPWKFNFTGFTAIVSPGSNGNSSGISSLDGSVESLQKQFEAKVGRVDIDLQVISLFRPLLAPLIKVAERGTASVQGSGVFGIIEKLFEKYIVCDYQGALACNSDLGIGLFDAVVVTSTAFLVIASLQTLFVPGATALFTMVGTMTYYYIVMWLAYGASPLCTLPSGVFPFIMGIPACAPTDLSILIHETLPQCPLLPPSLIRDEDFAEASRTLCSTFGTAPRLKHCSEAVGFLNGFDTFFYLSAKNLPASINANIASNTALVLPDISQLAALYTPAYANSLGDAGRVCAIITLPGLFVSFIVLQLRILLLVGLIALVLLFAFAVYWLAWSALLTSSILIMQVEKGYIMGTYKSRVLYTKG